MLSTLFCFSELFFLVEWCGEDVCDVIPAKDVVAASVENLQKGDKCRAYFKGKEYDAKVIDLGNLI